MASAEWLDALLGAGAVGMLGAGYKAIKDWRESSWRHGSSAVADLERWRRDADDAREWEAAQHQWWRDWAGALEYLIVSRLGPSALPEKPPYPVREESGHD